MSKLSKAEALKYLGASAKQVDRELAAFRKTAAVMSQADPRLIDKYAKQWVGVYRGKVEASGSTLNSVLRQLDKMHIPTENVMVRYIDRHRRTMIL